MNQKEYEEDLERRQAEHLKNINIGGKTMGVEWQPCLHDGCPECIGTGRKKDGSVCVHMISCNCPKCRPYF